MNRSAMRCVLGLQLQDKMSYPLTSSINGANSVGRVSSFHQITAGRARNCFVTWITVSILSSTAKTLAS
ncbi:hypothetical protein D3C71_1890340 [compost metagenome]